MSKPKDYYKGLFSEHNEAENYFATGLLHEAQPLQMEEALYQQALHQRDVVRAAREFTEIYKGLPPGQAMQYKGLDDFVSKMLDKYLKYTYGLAELKEKLGIPEKE